MSDNDFFAERYATKLDRFTKLLIRAFANGNPMAEEFAEAWIDILDLIMENQKRTTELMNRVTEYYLKPPAESEIDPVE